MVSVTWKATFKEFVNGLYFYSEMLFKYNDVMYEVYFNQNDHIVLETKGLSNEFKTREEFEDKAEIDGRLLKDIWNDVSFAGFMYCG